MIKPLFTALPLLFPFLLILSPIQLQAQTAEAIGRVILATGEVNAVTNAGGSRALERGSFLFAEDTVVTGPSSYLQVRLRDSMLIAFQSDTMFTFNVYEYDGSGGAGDTAVMTLLRGGFRTVSGIIGEETGDDYRIDTRASSIAIRGTTHSAYFDASTGILYTGVEDGGTRVFNNEGFIDLGVNASYDFSQTLPGEAPVGLLEQPPQLIALPAVVNAAAAAGGEDFNASIAALAQANGAEDPFQAALSPLSTLALSTGDDGDALINPYQSVNDLTGLQAETNTSDGGANAGGEAAAPSEAASGDGGVAAAASTDAPISEDLAGDTSAGAGSLTGNDDSLGGTLDGAEETVADGTGAVEDGLAGAGDAVDGTVEETGGIVDDTVNGAVDEVDDTLADGTDTVEDGLAGTGDALDDTVADTGDTLDDTVADTGDALVDTVAETDDAVDDTVDSAVDDTGDVLADGTEIVDDGLAAVDGTLDDGAELAGTTIDGTLDDGTELTGTDTEGTTSDSSDTTSTDTTSDDTIVDSGEQIVDASLDTSTSLFALAPVSAAWNTLLAGDGDEGTSVDIRTGGESYPAAIYPDSNLSVSWGYWNRDATILSEANGSGALTAWHELVYWASVLPANMEALRELSGRWSFEVPAGAQYFLGGGNAGALSGLRMGFDVDLASGAISKGSFLAEVAGGAEVWKLDFSGQVNGATAVMGNFSNTAVGTSLGVQSASIEGRMKGVFTGNSGGSAGFVTGFSLQGDNGASLDGLGLLTGNPLQGIH